MTVSNFISCLGLLIVSLLVRQSTTTWTHQEADCVCDEFGPRCKDSVCARVPGLLTTASGAPVDRLTDMLTAGYRGPLVLQDTSIMEHFQHMHREKVPERVVHSNGCGAYGYFTVTKDITKYTKASLFGRVGKQTKVFVRFSTFIQESGSCDTVRDLKGAALKFYSDDGNWDITCINSPIFGIKEPMLYPDYVRSMKRHPATHLPNSTTLWDFSTLRPETSYLAIWLFTNRSIPDGYRHMPFHAVHSYTLVNPTGILFYVKFHFKPDLGEKYMNASFAITTCATDFDYNKRDLFSSILAGEFPSWTMYVQIMTLEQAHKYKWNPFDITKEWLEEHFPLMVVGKLVLNRSPMNHFAEVEQAAFSPSSLVPGIEPSPDTMLQARMFAYPDAQRHRIGVNYQQLPINCPIVKVKNQLRDGFMSTDNQDGEPNYYPNSFHPSVCREAAWTRQHACGYIGRYENDNSDDFSQAKLFWERLGKTDKEDVLTNMCSSVSGAACCIQVRAVQMFSKVNKDLGAALKACLSPTTCNTCS